MKKLKFVFTSVLRAFQGDKIKIKMIPLGGFVAVLSAN
jgi:hypothetical protein